MTKQKDGLGREAFYAHKSHAKARGIDFRFTYDEWRQWWETELGKLGPRAKRGAKRGDYGMCRFLDEGPYAPENVYCGQHSRNISDYAARIYRNLRVNDTALLGFGDTMRPRKLR